MPDSDLTNELLDTWTSSEAPSPFALQSPTPPDANTSVIIPIDADDLDPSDDEISLRQTLEQRFNMLSVDSHSTPAYFGKSSSFMFLQKAVGIRYGAPEGSPEIYRQLPEHMLHACMSACCQFDRFGTA